MRHFNSFQNGLRGIRIGPGYITPVIKYLIISNALIFLIQGASTWNLVANFGLNPQAFFESFPVMWYQTVTYMFLHDGFFHILFNMLVLWMFGSEIEKGWGAKPFLFYYLLCGFGGAILSLTFTPHSTATIIGASGAVYGILAAYWLMFPDRKIMMFPIFIPMKVRYAIPLIAVLMFLLGGARVAHLAHLGGALFGLIYLKLDWRTKKPLNWFRNMKYRRNVAKQVKKREEATEVMKRVDSILDKINEVGINNISAEDQQFLNDASKILSNDDNKQHEAP